MDERSDEIMSHIESQRAQLGENLNELEERVKRTTDWRVQVDRNPMLMMGIALGGGVLLGSIVAGKVGHSPSGSWSSSARNYGKQSKPAAGTADPASPRMDISSPALSSEYRGKITDTLENIKGALLAFGTAKLKEFVSEALPGFSEHFNEQESRRKDPNAPNWNTGVRDYSRQDYHEPTASM